jgi:hypothetical protein
MGRTDKVNISLKITIANGLNFLLTVVGGFLIRTLLIRAFGNEYIGLTSLFHNFVSLLSLSELGIGLTMMSFLFKPLHDHDFKRVESLLLYFRRLYIIIGSIILLGGSILFFFLDNIIQNSSFSQLELRIIYSLLLIPEIMKYLFYEYKSILFNADQKSYVLIFRYFFIGLFQYLIQFLFIVYIKNFLLVSVILFFANISKGFIINIYFNKFYGNLLNVKNKFINVSQTDRKGIQDKIKNLFFLKIGDKFFHSTDNIIISSFFGISILGIFSNYILIVTMVKQIHGILISSFQTMLGKKFHESTLEHSYLVFKSLELFNYLIIVNFSIIFISITQYFISIWLGTTFVLDNSITFWLALNIFLAGSFVVSIYQYEALGLFQYGKFVLFFGSILNILLSLIFGNFFGLPGILSATSVSYFLSIILYFPFIVYRKVYNKDFFIYLRRFFFFLSIFLVFGIININLFFVKLNVFSAFMFLGFELIILNIIFFFLYHKNPEFKWLKSKVRSLFLNP